MGTWTEKQEQILYTLSEEERAALLYDEQECRRYQAEMEGLIEEHLTW